MPQCDNYEIRRNSGAHFYRISPWSAVLAGLVSALVVALPRPANAVCSLSCFTIGSGPTTGSVSIHDSSNAALFDLGSNFLERLGKQATYGFDKALGSNPGGGGASSLSDVPVYRAWSEVYGFGSRTNTQAMFAGDKRRALGGVLGISTALSPNWTIGISADQSRTHVDVTGLVQSANVDLTQLGANAIYQNGPWTMALAYVHGFARVHSSRFDGVGTSTASYGAHIDGALGELSYYYELGQQGRIVPKIALEWTHSVTDALTEVGPNAISASQQTGERTRLLLGAEVGRYWIVDRQIVDLSGYGKLVDNLVQNIGGVIVTPGGISVQGIRESTLGLDAGATLAILFTRSMRGYLAYDGKFRDGYQSHTGTAGIDIRW